MTETSEKTVSEPIQTESLMSEAGRSLMTLAKAQESPGCEPILRREPGSPEIAVTELRATVAQLLEPLAQSSTEALTAAFGKLNQLIQESESRQCSTIEATLQKWEGERESKAAERLMEVEAMRMRSQSEINRILHVMWLGTGVAAGCAVSALYLFRN